jgi:hypothetical protein
MMPCKEMKCLKYPACVTHQFIDCEILRDEYEFLMNENKGLSNRTSKTWGTLRTILPKLLTIKRI